MNSINVKGGRSFPTDILILATGYNFDFPYLEPKSLIPINDVIFCIFFIIIFRKF